MLIGPAQMAIALAIDAAIGWPDALYTRIGHPVVWLGRLISAGDKALNHDTAAFPQRRLNGTALALAMIVLCTALGRLLDGGPEGWPRIVIGGILAWPLVAARSLQTHVAAVARPLATGDTEGARAAVAMIVGRDTRPLDTAGIARAAIESLAENTSDGVIAPLFWGAAFGLPGPPSPPSPEDGGSRITGPHNRLSSRYASPGDRIDAHAHGVELAARLLCLRSLRIALDQ